MKSGLRSTAEMCTVAYLSTMDGVQRHSRVRIMGPQALSRIRRVRAVGGGAGSSSSAVLVVAVGGAGGSEGREGVIRLMSCLARRMLQPPVRWL